MLGIFLDTEANGLNPHVHVVLEIACKIVDLTNGAEKASFEALVRPSHEAWALSDPESLQVTGFTWEEAQRGQECSDVARQIIELFTRHKIRRKEAVFICQNPSFDRVFFTQIVSVEQQEALKWPYHWLDLASMHWALALQGARQRGEPLPWQTGLSKDSIAGRYGIAPEGKPHRAMNGVRHLMACYAAVVGWVGK